MDLAQFISDFKIYSDRDEEKLFSLFQDYILAVQETNKVMNLTAITDTEEIIEKHLYDSALVLKHFDFKNKNILDVGTGAGFPGLVLGILNSSFQVTLLDSNQKKISFLKNLVENLRISNVHMVSGRSEEKPVQNEFFDYIVCRAVSSLSTLLEITSYAVKVEGHLICYKSQKFEDELKESSNACKVLNFSCSNIFKDELPTKKELRVFIDFLKTDSTPFKYPRNFSQISKKPL